MNEFEIRYQSFDNRKLLLIIREPDKYQADALKAAKKELRKRDVSESEISNVNAELSERSRLSQLRQNRVDDIGNKAKSLGTSLINSIDPIQNEASSVDKKINRIVVFFIIIALFGMFSEVSILNQIFFEGDGNLDVGEIYYFVFPLLLPFVIAGLFGLRKRIGWILVGIQSGFQFFIGAVGLWRNMNRETSKQSEFENGFIDLFDNILYSNPIEDAVLMAVFGTVFWLIYRTEIRERFDIGLNSVVITIGLAFLLVFFFRIISL